MRTAKKGGLALLLLVACGGDSGTEPESEFFAVDVQVSYEKAPRSGCLVTFRATANDPLKMVFYKAGFDYGAADDSWHVGGQFQGSLELNLGNLVAGEGVYTEWQLQADSYFQRDQENVPKICEI